MANDSLNNLVAGGVAGLGSRMVTAPLDLLRIRLQLHARTSVGEILSKIYHNHGILGLYRGNLAAIYLWMGYSSVQFSVYNATKDALEDSNNNRSIHKSMVHFLSGAWAGVLSTLLTYPLDTMRTAFAAHCQSTTKTVVSYSSIAEPNPLSQQRSHSGTTTMSVRPPTSLLDFCQTLYKKNGLRGFYAGVYPATVQIIPYMGLTFCIYEWLQQRNQTTDRHSVSVAAYAGSVSGALAKTVVYPLDTVKRRMQARAFFDAEPRTATTLWKTTREVVRREGVWALYRGIVPSVAKTALGTSVTFALFRGTKNLLEGATTTGEWDGEE